MHGLALLCKPTRPFCWVANDASLPVALQAFTHILKQAGLGFSVLLFSQVWLRALHDTHALLCSFSLHEVRIQSTCAASHC